MAKDKRSSKVTIGKVRGNVHNSIIEDGDITGVIMSDKQKSSSVNIGDISDGLTGAIIAGRRKDFMSDKQESSSVNIGDVSGDIYGSIIAGRDVKDATITLGGQPTPADKEPTIEEFKQLLAELQTELAAVVAQQEALKEVSAAAPFTAQGAEQSVKAAAEKTQAALAPEEAESVQKSLSEATSLLGGILDSAKTVAEKATDVGRAVKPIAETLEPLVEKLGVAALWAAKLWLMG